MTSKFRVPITIRTSVATAIVSEQMQPTRFGPNGRAIGDAPSFAIASGIIVSRNGYVLTNAHVVAGESEAEVRLADGRIYTARVVGADRSGLAPGARA